MISWLRVGWGLQGEHRPVDRWYQHGLQSTDHLSSLEKVSYLSFLSFQFRHKSDNQVNNRQSQVLINGM